MGYLITASNHGSSRKRTSSFHGTNTEAIGGCNFCIRGSQPLNALIVAVRIVSSATDLLEFLSSPEISCPLNGLLQITYSSKVYIASPTYHSLMIIYAPQGIPLRQQDLRLCGRAYPLKQWARKTVGRNSLVSNMNDSEIHQPSNL